MIFVFAGLAATAAIGMSQRGTALSIMGQGSCFILPVIAVLWIRIRKETKARSRKKVPIRIFSRIIEFGLTIMRHLCFVITSLFCWSKFYYHTRVCLSALTCLFSWFYPEYLFLFFFFFFFFLLSSSSKWSANNKVPFSRISSSLSIDPRNCSVHGQPRT